MLALAYDAGLRREELCLLATGDIDPAHRLLTVRAETTKSRRGRVVPYSEAAGSLLSAYLAHRRTLTRSRGPLFVSESRRNAAGPLSFWSWSKIVHSLAERADLPQLSTHTFRHLCLTDLARAGWVSDHDTAKQQSHRRSLSLVQCRPLACSERLRGGACRLDPRAGRRLCRCGRPSNHRAVGDRRSNTVVAHRPALEASNQGVCTHGDAAVLSRLSGVGLDSDTLQPLSGACNTALRPLPYRSRPTDHPGRHLGQAPVGRSQPHGPGAVEAQRPRSAWRWAFLPSDHGQSSDAYVAVLRAAP